ncbi:hypothetical protein FX982_00001 [Pseudomonas graminis]|uniref:Uncharacterized protein n=1 Tax=Pseudomonas graminis TaxID=158627 RepID=A0A6M8MD63_9PSED|nr:hypothetical protein FX982_00001 [Pseudomonas graminis]
MWRVSSLFNAPRKWLVPLARAARSSARLVMDFEPGGDTWPVSGTPGGMTVMVWFMPMVQLSKFEIRHRSAPC